MDPEPAPTDAPPVDGRPESADAQETAPSAPPVRPPSRRPILYAILAVAVAVAVVAALVISGVTPFSHPGAFHPPVVRITSVTLGFVPGDNPCFGTDYVNQTPSVLAAGGQLTYYVALKDLATAQARGCTVGAVTVTTHDFTLLSANVPLKVPDRGKTVLTVVIEAPTVAYNGSLQLSAPVTYISPNVKVANQNVTFSPASNPCGVTPFGGAGFSAFSGDRYNDSVAVISISPQKYCSVTAVSASTSGFAVVSASTPVSLPINSIASVSFVLQLPPSAYMGDVAFTLTLTWS